MAHFSTEIIASSPRAEAEPDALRGEESTEDEQRSG